MASLDDLYAKIQEVREINQHFDVDIEYVEMVGNNGAVQGRIRSLTIRFRDTTAVFGEVPYGDSEIAQHIIDWLENPKSIPVAAYRFQIHKGGI